MTLNCAGAWGSFKTCNFTASGVLIEHQTWAKPTKNNCLLVKFNPGSCGSGLASAHFSNALKAAFKPPLSAIFSPRVCFPFNW